MLSLPLQTSCQWKILTAGKSIFQATPEQMLLFLFMVSFLCSGNSHEEELNLILRETIMIRRAKKDVLKDLPDKIRTSIPVTVSENFKKVEFPPPHPHLALVM